MDWTHALAMLGAALGSPLLVEWAKVRLAARAESRKASEAAKVKAAEVPLEIAKAEITGRFGVATEVVRQDGETDRALAPKLMDRLKRVEERLDECEKHHRDCERARGEDARRHANEVAEIRKQSDMIVEHASAMDRTYQEMVAEKERQRVEFEAYKLRHPSGSLPAVKP